MSIRIILQEILNNSIILSPLAISAVPGRLSPKKLHQPSPMALQQSNIYLVNKLFHYARLGTKFDDWRTLSKILGPLALASDPFFFGWVSREHTIQISDRRLLLSSYDPGHTAHPKDFLYWTQCSRATCQ